MSKKKGNGFFSSHTKSSAMMVSLAVHAVLIVAALSFVAVKVIIKEDKTFEATKVNRPRVKLKKLQVPVQIKKRKAPAPKLRKNIIAKPRKKSLDIKMPEITGIKGGMGGTGGTGLGSLGFSLDLSTLFGGKKGVGNELEGTFYDLKTSNKGTPTGMDLGKYDEALQRFLGSWSKNRLDDYFKAPKSLYSVAFMMPNMDANAAPDAYEVADVVQPKMWVALYTGKIAAPETGRYRFCGMGDDILYVRVKRRLVLDACWPDVAGRLTGWESDDDDNRKFNLGNNNMVMGDWIHLTKGKAVDIEILLGERPGGRFCCQLLIEQDGVEYSRVPFKDGTRPVLPVFKLAPVSEKLVEQMKINPDEATLDGPVFGAMK